VADDELAAAVEQVQQAGLAVRTVEEVILADLDHGQLAPLDVERVPRPGHRLLLGQQLLASNQPLLAGYHLRKTHLALLPGWLSWALAT
jgi:hypothetical protein